MAVHSPLAGHAGPEPKPDDGGTALAYGLAVLCWFLSAGIYIAAKWVAVEMPPWTFCFWRVFIAFLVLLPLVYGQRGAMIEALRSRGVAIVAIGGLGLAICQGFIYTGLEFADATTAGIIMALMPIMTMILARFLVDEHMGVWQTVGSVIALFGMIIIIGRGDPAAVLRLDVNPGDLWIVASAFCFALYTVLLRKAKFTLPRLPLLVLLLGSGALVSLPFYLYELAADERSALDGHGLVALAYAAIPGGALMYLLYNRSVESLGASRASNLLYLQTIFVALLAYLLLGERLHGYDLVGAGVIVIGLLLVTLLKPTEKKPA